MRTFARSAASPAGSRKKNGEAVGDLLLDLFKLPNVRLIGQDIRRLLDLYDEDVFVVMAWLVDNDIGEHARAGGNAVGIRQVDLFGVNPVPVVFGVDGVFREGILEDSGQARA